MIFKDIWVLLFIPVVILLVYFWKRRDVSSSLRFSSKELIKSFRPTLRLLLSRTLVYLRMAALILILLALARLRVPLEETKVRTEGIDIVLTVDCSGSMLAEDFKINGRRQNRLEVAKKVIENFIRMRKSDRIGMVAFAARAYTVCPLTLDYDWLIKNLERVEIGAIEDGTAVGSAISSSLSRLEDSQAKSETIILLTDGVNNTGKISPLTAAEATKALGVKIYTIGVGTRGLVPYPVKDPWGRTVYQEVEIPLDEETLEEIARITGGRYFRATDTESLKDIYTEIDKLEKTPVEEVGYQEYKELFPGFLVAGLIILILEIVLSDTVLRRLP